MRRAALQPPAAAFKVSFKKMICKSEDSVSDGCNLHGDEEHAVCWQEEEEEEEEDGEAEEEEEDDGGTSSSSDIWKNLNVLVKKSQK